MKLLALLLCCFPLLLGAAPSRTRTYTAGQIINPADVTENEDNIFAYLQAGVDTISTNAVTAAAILDGTITFAKLASLPTMTVGTFTRDTSAASGTQTISGVGFTPRFVLFVMGNTAGEVGEASVGFDDGTTAVDILDNYNITVNEWQMNNNGSIDTVEGSGNGYAGKVSSFNADGFVVTWTRSGTPT